MGRVYDAEGIAPTINTCGGGGREPKIAALRGRNPDNPSERGKSNGNYKQRLEMNENGTSNTLTSVQKDNLVVEPYRVGNIYPSQGQNGNVYDANGVSPTISSGQGVTGNGIGSCNAPKVAEPQVVSRYRIRKLTPRECFRLMGVDDADIDKIQASGISNTRQYHCAGNSIVVDVLYYQFFKAFIDRTPTEPFYQQTLF